MGQSTKPEEKHELGQVLRVPARAPIDVTKDISQPIHSKANLLKAQLKSRMRENFTYGSVRALKVKEEITMSSTRQNAGNEREII